MEPLLQLSFFIVFIISNFPRSLYGQNIPNGTSTANASSTACAAIAQQTDTYFPASIAYDCLVTVPFNSTVASQLLSYYNQTLQFQSTLAYLRNPPATYQQPGTDVIGGLDAIQLQINSGGYPNEYEFESAILRLVQSSHDGHLVFSGGASAVFSFTSPYQLLSISSDGIQMPRVYVADDFVPFGPKTGFTPSPVATINGQNVTDFLRSFAANNSFGFIGPYADWNSLMYSAAADIQGLAPFNPALANTPFYPGDSFSMTFENGSSAPNTTWFASANTGFVDLSTVTTGQDFYDAFVVISDFDTESSAFDFSGSSLTEVDPALLTAWPDTAYPMPDIVQEELGSEGWITGYYDEDNSLAILSIPNFIGTGAAAQNFSSAVSEFLAGAKQREMQKVVIDLQQNGGGTALLATDTFRQFFPTIEPFSGNRFRANDVANQLGNTLTPYYSTLAPNDPSFEDLSSSFWVSSVYLDASSNESFASWPAYFGPHAENDDLFTNTARANFSSTIYDMSITQDGIVAYGFGERPATSPQPYAAQDIVLLTDSICSSACSLFVEMMNTEAGVRTVVVGGQPKPGTMQAVAGVRGAAVYDNESLDDDIFGAQQVNNTLTSTIPDRSYTFDLLYAGFNFRDQVRQNAPNMPLQFDYIPADCRIFYTPDTINNYANLWAYAAAAIWTNSSLCVQDSTNPDSTGANITGVAPTAAEALAWSRGSPPAPNNKRALRRQTKSLRPKPAPSPFRGSIPSVGSGFKSSSRITPSAGPNFKSNPPSFSPTSTRTSTSTCRFDYQCGSQRICSTTKFTQSSTGRPLQPITQCTPQCSATNRICGRGQSCLQTQQLARDSNGVSALYNYNLCLTVGCTATANTGCAAGYTCRELNPCGSSSEDDIQNVCVPATSMPQCVSPGVAPPSATLAPHTPSFVGGNTEEDGAGQAGGARSKTSLMRDGKIGGVIAAGMAPVGKKG